MKSVAVLATGVANTASVLAALRRQGVRPTLIDSKAALLAAERLVLPGVGRFAAAMETLRERGLSAALRERLLQGQPTLAICLGLQLLATGSEESPGCNGLGLFSCAVRRFDQHLRTPHVGFAAVEPQGQGPLVAGHAYFTHSYRLLPNDVPSGWQIALADHGGPFVAAIARGAVLATQFHPELSGRYGAELLARWFELDEVAA